MAFVVFSNASAFVANTLAIVPSDEKTADSPAQPIDFSKTPSIFESSDATNETSRRRLLRSSTEQTYEVARLLGIPFEDLPALVLLDDFRTTGEFEVVPLRDQTSDAIRQQLSGIVSDFYRAPEHQVFLNLLRDREDVARRLEEARRRVRQEQGNLKRLDRGLAGLASTADFQYENWTRQFLDPALWPDLDEWLSYFRSFVSEYDTLVRARSHLFDLSNRKIVLRPTRESMTEVLGRFLPEASVEASQVDAARWLPLLRQATDPSNPRVAELELRLAACQAEFEGFGLAAKIEERVRFAESEVTDVEAALAAVDAQIAATPRPEIGHILRDRKGGERRRSVMGGAAAGLRKVGDPGARASPDTWLKIFEQISKLGG